MFDLGGTFRTREPAETIRLVMPLVHRFGISRVANVTGLDVVGVPVWCAIRPLARSLTVSQGKGISHELAAISAVMESIELHHGEQSVPAGETYRLAEAFGNKAFADPLSLPIRSDACFRASAEVAWVAARNESSHQLVYVPRELLDRDSLVTKPKQNLFYSSSNGLASGNCRTEAVLHGLAELVERDQLAFWQIRREFCADGLDTKVDLDSVDDCYCRDVLDKVVRSGLEISVWYSTTTINVPAFTCSIWDSWMATPYPHRSGGHGCHPYKRVALLRAITEALQSRLTHISGGRDDMYWSKYRRVLPTYLEHNAKHVAYIRDEVPNVAFDSIPEAPRGRTAVELLSWLIGTVFREAGADCLVVDLSDHSLPISVVQVIAPGLELSADRELYSPGPRMIRYVKYIGLS